VSNAECQWMQTVIAPVIPHYAFIVALASRIVLAVVAT